MGQFIMYFCFEVHLQFFRGYKHKASLRNWHGMYFDIFKVFKTMKYGKLAFGQYVIP